MQVGDLVRLGERNFTHYLGIITASKLIQNVRHYDVLFFKDSLGHIKNLPFHSIREVRQ